MARQFKVGEKFEGIYTGEIRTVLAVHSYEVEIELRYLDGRVTTLFSTKRSMREQIADGDLREVQ